MTVDFRSRIIMFIHKPRYIDLQIINSRYLKIKIFKYKKDKKRLNHLLEKRMGNFLIYTVSSIHLTESNMFFNLYVTN